MPAATSGYAPPPQFDPAAGQGDRPVRLRRARFESARRPHARARSTSSTSPALPTNLAAAARDPGPSRRSAPATPARRCSPSARAEPRRRGDGRGRCRSSTSRSAALGRRRGARGAPPGAAAAGRRRGHEAVEQPACAARSSTSSVARGRHGRGRRHAARRQRHEDGDRRSPRRAPASSRRWRRSRPATRSTAARSSP